MPCRFHSPVANLLHPLLLLFLLLSEAQLAVGFLCGHQSKTGDCFETKTTRATLTVLGLWGWRVRLRSASCVISWRWLCHNWSTHTWGKGAWGRTGGGVLTVPGIRRRFQMTCGHILKSFLGPPKLPQSRLKLKVFALIDGHYEVATPPPSPGQLSVCHPIVDRWHCRRLHFAGQQLCRSSIFLLVSNSFSVFGFQLLTEGDFDSKSDSRWQRTLRF